MPPDLSVEQPPVALTDAVATLGTHLDARLALVPAAHPGWSCVLVYDTDGQARVLLEASEHGRLYQQIHTLLVRT